MDLEDAFNLALPPHHVAQCMNGDEVGFRAEIPGYPQCTGYGPTAEEAVRVCRHMFTQLRDGQAAVAVSDLESARAARLKEAVRFVVTRALV